MLLMVVCEPEDEVTAEHLKYLLKAGRENADSVLVTYTGTVTEKAHEIGENTGRCNRVRENTIPQRNQ